MAATYDRAAVMHDAWKEWRSAKRRGWDKLPGADRWDWPRCLRFAQARARASRPEGFAALEAAMQEALADAKNSPRRIATQESRRPDAQAAFRL